MLDEGRYAKVAKLGKGTYGIVYKVIEIKTGQYYAAKMIHLTDESEGIPATTLREVSILKRMNHCNIIKFHEAFLNENSLTVMVEFMDSDLYKLLFRMGGRPLEPALCCSYAYQILSGLYYLHTHRVMHRDIKPANLLIDRDGHLKICDYGLARSFTIPISELARGVVTPWYRSPELLLHNDFYDVGIDIWSAGCVIAEMAGGTALFKGDGDLDMAHHVFRIMGTPAEDVLESFAEVKNGNISIPIYEPENLAEVLKTNDLQLVDLLRKLLTVDPRRRITAKEALNHPYFDNLAPLIKQFSSPRY